MFATALAPHHALADSSKHNKDFSAIYVFADSLSDPGTPCLQAFVAPASQVCSDPHQHLFWNEIHRTRAGHRLAGDIAFNQLSLQ